MLGVIDSITGANGTSLLWTQEKKMLPYPFLLGLHCFAYCLSLCLQGYSRPDPLSPRTSNITMIMTFVFFHLPNLKSFLALF